MTGECNASASDLQCYDVISLGWENAHPADDLVGHAPITLLEVLMAVRTVYSDRIHTGWIDRGLGMLMAGILLTAGVAVCVYGMLSFRSQAENSAAGPSVAAPIVSDFGLAEE